MYGRTSLLAAWCERNDHDSVLETASYGWMTTINAFLVESVQNRLRQSLNRFCSFCTLDF